MIKIYIADTSYLSDEKIFHDMYHQVSKYRQLKVDSLRVQKSKQLSLGAGLLFKRACLDFGIPYEKTKIIFNEHGKPSFDKDTKFKFNLSHSGSKVMCAISEYEIGCDVEQILNVKIKIAKKYFSEAEYNYIVNCNTEEDKAIAFYRIWTLKESYIKCIGRGLSLSLRDFSVIHTGSDIKLCHSESDSRYSFFEYDHNDGYRYACCVKNVESEIDPQILYFDNFKY